VKTGRGVIYGRCLSPIIFNLYSAHVTTEDLEEFGDSQIGGNVIGT
jgi:hypothetical protein